MNEYIILLGPIVISLIIFDYLSKFKMSFKEICYYFFSMTFLINSLTTVITFSLFKIEGSFIDAIRFYPMFSIKYALIATGIGILLSLLIYIIKKNISFEVEIKEKKLKNKGEKSKHEKNM